MSAGDPRFHALLKVIGDLHDKKQEDYGTNHDAFANVRASEKFGVPAWVGALIRMHDKIIRLQKYARRGVLANESAKDSMLDISVYALIAYILYEETEETGESMDWFVEKLKAERGFIDGDA
jgi:hypothetical protein